MIKLTKKQEEDIFNDLFEEEKECENCYYGKPPEYIDEVPCEICHNESHWEPK